MTEKIIPQEQAKNQNIESHHNLEINHAKTTKHSFHNLKH